MNPLVRRRPVRGLAAAAGLVALALTTGCLSDDATEVEGGSLAEGVSLEGASLTVGSKEFTEQLILCHITSLALRSAGAEVAEQCGLQGSNATRAALTSGNIDVYWEYTGTAWVNFLQHTDPINDAAQLYQATAEEDLAKNQIRWLDPAPANNTYAVIVKRTTAEELGVETLSDYANLVNTDPANGSFCTGNEFASRNDGLPGLQEAYGFEIPRAHLATLADGAIYNAVANNNPCNFGMAAATDGRIRALDLITLDDDKQFFPVYNPAPTIRNEVYEAHPDIAQILNTIAAALTDEALQELNGRVDIDGEEPVDVAEDWLKSQGFIGG